MLVNKQEFQKLAAEGKLFSFGNTYLLAKKTSALAVLDLIFAGLADDVGDPFIALKELFYKLYYVAGWAAGHVHFGDIHYVIMRANDSDTAIIFWFDYNKRAGYFTAVKYPLVYVHEDVPLTDHIMS